MKTKNFMKKTEDKRIYIKEESYLSKSIENGRIPMIHRKLTESGAAQRGPVRRAVLLCLLAVFCLSVTGCVKNLNFSGKKEPVEYVICKDTSLPEQLQTLLKEKKKKPVTFTYRNSMYIYLVVCYGKKDFSGYSVRIEECWRSGETLFLRTQLMGPAAGEDSIETDTYPYIVVRCPQMDVFCVIDS